MAYPGSTEDRIVQIARCVYEIHRCEEQMAKGNKDMGGPWLGYMDWMEELHGLIWNWKA